jgi:hypothetical protein
VSFGQKPWRQNATTRILNSMDFSSVWLAVGSGVVALVAFGLATYLVRGFTSAEARRIEMTIGGEAIQLTHVTLAEQNALIEAFVERSAGKDGISPATAKRLAEEAVELAGVAEKTAADEQTRLSLRYYAQGVGQAQVSFYFSLAFASVGFMVIIAGVLIAIIRPNSATEAAVTVGAGAITDGIGALFFALANRSRTVMTSFIDKLRADREREREFLKSLELMELVQSGELRDSLKAIAALRFLRAESDIGSLPGFPKFAHFDPDQITSDHAEKSDTAG